jgi:hypothetical protein
VIVDTTGTYDITSNGLFDSYGCLYDGSFNPLYPSQNLITTDDDGGGNRQFQISRSLQSGRIYILVVTTYSTGITGSFTIRAGGPASVYMTSITPTTPRTSITPTAPTTSAMATSE